ncbi:hypothetical protein [Lentibacillus sediminis]|uniref:hypothetical protein n=1 Tax=Lentibacillus sediminis TaxID=1940529 RepID=UPI000C1BCD2F|nr:hypothetical protein [Lentibacillus sediminis]
MESAILATASEQSFVIDFHKGSEYKNVSVWIEKYEDGELADDEIGRLSLMAEETGSIIFTLPKENEEEKNRTFNIGITSGGSTASSTGLDNNLDEKSSLRASFQVGETSLEEGEAVLAGIVYSDDENGTTSISANFYEDPGEMEKYDVVYLFKAAFVE